MTTKTPRAVFRSRLTPLITRGPGRLSRRRAGGPVRLEFYYEPGDPHSHLCAQLLEEIQRRLTIPVEVKVVGAPAAELYPEVDRQRAFALADARCIAAGWGLRAPGPNLVPEEAAFRAARALLGARNIAEFAEREAVCAAALFHGEDIGARVRSFAALDKAATARQLETNTERRTQLGHYLPAMWQFDGEWFWGLDRLQLLEARLRAAKVLRGDAPLAHFDASRAALPDLGSGAELEFWFSFRSPYSYLAAAAIEERPELHDRLRVRPVLPMAMRGLPVPKAKRFYIVRDVQRLADEQGRPFGHIADPLGPGVRRLLAVYPLADGARQQLAFLVAAGRAVWGQGIDVATDAGLQFVVEQAGMRWSQASAMLREPIDIGYAENNREALFAAGLWGVPSFRLGEFVTWGQDRIALVAEALGRQREPRRAEVA